MVWKSSVTRLDDRARRLALRQAAGDGWWPFALTILAELEDNWRTEDEPVLDRIYRSIAAGHGIYKMTSRNRFPEIDDAIAGMVDDYLGDKPVRIHEVGASNAITSLDLLRTIDQQCGSADRPAPVTILASDRYDCLDLVNVPGSSWIVAFDRGGRPLQVIGRKIVLHGSVPPSWRYPVNRVAFHLWVRQCVTRSRAALDRGEGVRRIQLFHPEAVQTSRTDDRLRLGYHNLLELASESFHIVRVMNLLTRVHLSPEQICRGARLCVDSLVPGGTFIFGRTMDDEDRRPRVTAARFEQGEPEILWETNGGAEDRDLILGIGAGAKL